jgi:predicted GNAT superfamily acetyltransferase
MYLFCMFVARIAAQTDVIVCSDEFHATYSFFGVDRIVVGDVYRKTRGIARVFRQSRPQTLFTAASCVCLCNMQTPG